MLCSLFSEFLSMYCSTVYIHYQCSELLSLVLSVNGNLFCQPQADCMNFSCLILVANPCVNMTNECSFMCLLSGYSAEGYTCSCPDGMVLAEDERNCICE